MTPPVIGDNVIVLALTPAQHLALQKLVDAGMFDIAEECMRNGDTAKLRLAEQVCGLVGIEPYASEQGKAPVNGELPLAAEPYAPLTKEEVRDLSAMVWGAPAVSWWLEDVGRPFIAEYERVRGLNLRPVDPASGVGSGGTGSAA